MSGEGEALTFQMTRESEAASRLKAIVSDLLPQLCDDVLAEYTTVLVCNGKSQRQATEDLEAFLGEHSGEFVTCLWKLLQKEFAPDEENSAPDPMPDAKFGSHDALINRRLNSKKNYNSNVICGLKAKDDNASGLSATAHIPSKVKSMRILRHVGINDSPRRVKATDNNDWNSSPSNYSGKISSIAVSAFQQPSETGPDRCEKTVHKSSGILQQLYFPKEEMDLTYSQATRLGSGDAPSHRKLKSRVSVWDRLGSPKSDLFIDIKSPGMPEIDIRPHEKQVLHRNEPALPAANSEHIKRFQREVPALGYRHGSFKSHPARQLRTGIITSTGPHIAHNLTSKRHYGDISPNAGDDSVGKVSSVLHRDPSQDIKRPNSLSHQSAKADLFSEILNAKQKLHQIEMRILQSKLLKKQKIGVLPSQSGDLRDRQGDMESRTIHVTDVHFAATEEAISVFFAKCGAVENVLILTDPETLKPKGAAFVTFASKESVDRAILLSGRTFYSRIIKVMRATEMVAGATTSMKSNRSSFSRPHNHWSRHLQWHRDPAVPIPSVAPLHDP